MNRDTNFVKSVEKGLAVIRCFSAERPSMRLSQVAEQLGITRAAARRYLLTLQQLGYIESIGRQFSLTAQVLDLGNAYISSRQDVELTDNVL